MVEDMNPDNSTEGIKSSKRTRVVTQTKYPLPDGRTDFTTHHLKIISAYAIMSPNGSKELKYSEFSETILGFNFQYVSGNNKFLETIGLISSCGGGRYKPTQDCLNFYQNCKWDSKIVEAKKILKKRLLETWFWEATGELFELNNIISKGNLIEHLGHKADADPIKHKKSLKIIIDYLLYSSLIKEVEETDEIKLADESGNIEQPIIAEQPINKKAIEEVPFKKEIVHEKAINPETSFKNQININISIELTISPESSEEDIKGKVRALIETLNDLN